MATMYHRVQSEVGSVKTQANPQASELIFRHTQTPIREVNLKFDSDQTSYREYPYDWNKSSRQPDLVANRQNNQTIQTQLKVNTPGDKYEKEADAIASKIMTISGSHRQVSCECGGTCPKCRKNDENEVMTQVNGHNDYSTSKDTSHVQNVLKSPSHKLEGNTLEFMNKRFGYDFGAVRIFDSPSAGASAEKLHANAYTVGENLVFNVGKYSPQTTEGRRLIAHELVHTIQQTNTANSPASGISSKDTRTRQTESHSSQTIFRQTQGPVSPLTLPVDGIEMPWVGHGAPSSELGYLRDSRYFWTEYSRRYPGNLSDANKVRIGNNLSPLVDAQWVASHPGHASYIVDTLEHHHVGQGSKAVPLPSGLHDAHTVFHPQRRVVGTPSGGTRPLPPQPTHADAQAEVGRHVRQGRIRGQGITENNIPNAPSIPPASQIAGVSSNELSNVGHKKSNVAPAPTKSSSPSNSGSAGIVVPHQNTESPDVAKSILKSMATESKILKLIRILGHVSNLLDFISALKMLDQFTNMAQNALSGKGFIFGEQIAQFERIAEQSKQDLKAYSEFSESLTAMQQDLWRISRNPKGAGLLVPNLDQLYSQLRESKSNLAPQLERIVGAYRGVNAKVRYAERILTSTSAQAGLAMATYGTAAIAEIFGAHEDLQRIEGSLSSTLAALKQLDGAFSNDLQFIDDWRTYLLQVCVSGGVCSAWTIDTGFFTSKMYYLPGE